MNKNLKRKIAVVTGTRAEYGYLKPLMDQIKKDKKIILSLYVCGTHLAKNYGDTIQEIMKDGFEVAQKIDMKVKDKNSPYDFAHSIALGVSGFAKALKEDKPDIMVIFGDRIEPFAAAAAANALNVPIVHIGGGDTASGDIDNNLRHAITKLSHIHFAGSEKSKERILKLGEEKWRVFNAGALTLDVILKEKLVMPKKLFGKYNISGDRVILISYHPVTTESESAGSQIEEVLEAIYQLSKENDGFSIIIIHPNNYPGRDFIVKAINRYQTKMASMSVFSNLSHIDYLSFLAYASVFVGNSSSGIIEAPSLGTPFVSVGTRQKGREMGKNVIEVGNDKKEILAGIKKALWDKKFLNTVKKRWSPYGKGKASVEIKKIIKEIKIDKKLIQKKLTY